MTLGGHQRRDDGGGCFTRQDSIISTGCLLLQVPSIQFSPKKSACNLVGSCGTWYCTLQYLQQYNLPLPRLTCTHEQITFKSINSKYRPTPAFLRGITNPNKISNTREIPQNYHILCINSFIPLNDPCFLQSFFFLFLPFCEAIDLTKVVIPKGSNSSTGPTTTPPGFSKVHAMFSLLAGKKDFCWCQ